MNSTRNQNPIVSTHTPDDTTTESLSAYEVKIVKKIIEITDRGNNAEVRRQKNGTLTVYEVRKSIV